MPAGTKSSDIGMRTTRVTTPASVAGALGEPVAAPSPPIVFPAVFVPPPGAIYFLVQDAVDSAAVGEVVFGNQFKVPENHDAVINTVNFWASNADATMAGFTFAVLANGLPIPGFSGLQIPRLGGAQGLNISPAFIRLPQNQIVGASFVNALGAAHHVGVFLQGWMWSTTEGV